MARDLRLSHRLAKRLEISSHAILNAMFLAAQRIELVLTDMWHTFSVDIQIFLKNDSLRKIDAAPVLRIGQERMWMV